MPQLDQLTLLRAAAGPTSSAPASAGNWPDKDEWKYGRLTESPRDLPSYQHRRAQEISEYLYRANPLAHRILELTRDFVVGGGITFNAEDDKVQKLLDEFWVHPRNQWPLKFPQRILEYYMYGEALWRTDVDGTGRTFAIGVPPLDITDVVPDPRNPEEPLLVLLGDDSRFVKGRVKGGRPKRDLLIVRVDLNPRSETYMYRVGDAFFFRNNSITGGLRGYPELLPLSDWIDGYDQFGYLRMERATWLNTWFWDVTLEGFTQEEIDIWSAENLLLRPTQPGSFIPHNESVTIQAITPKLEAADASRESQELRRTITSGAGFPMSYIGGGESGRIAENLAVEPTHRTLVQKQEEVRNMMTALFDFVIDQAVVHGLNGIGTETNRTFTIGLPRIALRDVMRIGGALWRIAQALETAEDKQWLPPEQISRIFSALAEDLSVALPKEETKKKDEQKEVTV